LDAQTLLRAAAEVHAAATAVSDAQLALDEARLNLVGRQESLLAFAHRAVAYARVYGADDATLAERLDSIVLPKPGRRPRPVHEAPALPSEPADPAVRRRGRPRKVELDRQAAGAAASIGRSV
ncbi:MAG: hypothetical protein ABSC94_33240, partial [Polyangiaceae bacterium]